MNDETALPGRSADTLSNDPDRSNRGGDGFLLSLHPATIDQLVELVAARVQESQTLSPWMTRPEAAAYLRWPVSRLEKRRDVPHVRDEGRVMYHRDRLDEWLLREAA
jgi:hypothetical protein